MCVPAPDEDVTISFICSFQLIVHQHSIWDFCLLHPLSYVVFFHLTSHQALVEKDWLAFGHPFSDRVGMPNISGPGNFDLPRQSSSSGSFPSSPVRQSSGSAASQSASSSHAQNNYSPIFTQVSDQLFLSMIIILLVCLDIFRWVGKQQLIQCSHLCVSSGLIAFHR